MKPQHGTRKRPSVAKTAGAEAALSLQEELVAAIHGAFDVAVEIAVQEVTKLVGQATGDVYDQMRRENDSLKQRLQRAEALLDSVRREGGGGGGGCSPPQQQLPDATDHPDQPPHPKCNRKSLKPNNVHGVRGGTPPAGYSRADYEGGKEQRSGDDVRTQHGSDAASDSEECDACADALTPGVSEVMSPVCMVRMERMNQQCQDRSAQDHSSPQLASVDNKTTLEQVTIKQEKLEEEGESSACCLDSIKVEDFSPECMLAVQSKMMEEWKPEALDIQNEDSNSPLSCSGLNEVHSPNLSTNLPPSTDLPSLPSESPNIFQLAEPAPIPEASAQVYGIHVRAGRNHSHTNLYACKFCGQTFPLPSLLRRHSGQCPQKLQQFCQQPVVGSRRTKLQLYPPGCSPFCCTVCNREFNRMENLKTHLRIHTGERPYTCSVCSKCFRHSGALTRHFRIHTGEKPYVCGQCGKCFRNCGGLKFHQRSHSKQLH